MRTIDLVENFKKKYELYENEIYLMELIESQEYRFMEFNNCVENLKCELQVYDEEIQIKPSFVSYVDGNNYKLDLYILGSYNGAGVRSFDRIISDDITIHCYGREIKANIDTILESYREKFDNLFNVMYKNKINIDTNFWLTSSDKKIYIASSFQDINIGFYDQIKEKINVSNNEMFSFAFGLSNPSFYHSYTKKEVGYPYDTLHKCIIDNGNFSVYMSGIFDFLKYRKAFNKKSIKENDLSLYQGIILNKKDLPESISKGIERRRLK